jgi:membrane protein
MNRRWLSLSFRLFKRILTAWNNDNAMRWSASVAFYTMLSLAPLLVLMVAIAGFVYGQQLASGELVVGVNNLVSPDISPAIKILIANPHKPVTGLLAAIFGALTLFFGASSVLGELRDALNAIWRVPAPKSTQIATLLRLAKERFYSFLFILAFGLLLLVSLVLNTWLGAMEQMLGWDAMSSGYVFHFAVILMSFLVIAFVFAAVFKVIPDTPLDWRDVAVGGLVTALLFVGGKQLIALYVGRTALASAYGAAGSLVVMLVWVYYSAQVFFLGAEFTKVYAETFGSRKDSTKSS